MAGSSPRLKMRRGRFGPGGFKPPTVKIRSPLSGYLSIAGSPSLQLFTATAADDIQGDLSATIQWSSSLVGSPEILATGATVNLGSSLVAGSPAVTQIITALAVDAGGKVGSSTVTLRVINGTPVGGGSPIPQDTIVIWNTSGTDTTAATQDGVTFTLDNPAITPRVYAALSTGGGNFVGSPSMSIIFTNETNYVTSTDGIAWTDRAGTGPALDARGIEYVAGLGLWFWWAGARFYYTSTDGINWSAQRTFGASGEPSSGTGAIDTTWSEADGLLVAVSQWNDTIWSSSDGITWSKDLEASPGIGDAGHFSGVAYNPNTGEYLATRDNSSLMFTSTNGTTWTVKSGVTGRSSSGPGAIYWNDSLGLWMQEAWWSSDGLAWTAVSREGSGYGFNSVFDSWSPKVFTVANDGLAIIVRGTGQTGNGKVLVSTDGKTYTEVDVGPGSPTSQPGADYDRAGVFYGTEI